MTWPNRNTLWAHVLVDELARAGLDHATMAPGSRSTPLVLALAQHEDITLTVHIDERSAAFHALGIGKASGTPAAVVTTSGTAAANLHPAVIEACQSEAPLVLMTADRPPELKGTDANQTIDQVKLYGDTVTSYHDLGRPEISQRALTHLRALADRVIADARGTPAGPVHVNAPFAKPLEPTPVEDDVPEEIAETAPLAVHGRPDGRPYTRIEPRRASLDGDALARLASRLADAERPLIVAGATPHADRLGPAATRLAEATGAPLLADPLSGARFTPGAADHALGGYDLFLGALGFRDEVEPDLVLRLGRTPTSKRVATWLGQMPEIDQVVVDDGRAYKDHPDTASTYLRADPATAADRLADRVDARLDEAWTATWRKAEARTRQAIAEHLASEPSEANVLDQALEALPDGGQLVVGNSMPVRDLDTVGAPRDASIRVIGNRGASGIDGLVSTAIGAAQATQRPTIAVIGDLSLLHDTNGLHALDAVEAPLVLVVVNNDGGGIFHKLPISEHEAFTEYFATPHGHDLAHAAALHERPHQALDGPNGLRKALETALADPQGQVIEVLSERETNHARHQALRDRVEAAVETIDQR